MTRLSLLFALGCLLLDLGRIARISRAGRKIRDHDVPDHDPEPLPIACSQYGCEAVEDGPLETFANGDP